MFRRKIDDAALTSDETELQELLREVHRIDVQTRRLVTAGLAGGYVSVFRGAGLEFHDVREYAEGDDPRTVDWQVTARMGRPFVKTFVTERDLTVLFLLDVSLSTTGGFGVWSVRQTAARVCACLALSAARSGDKVGLVAFSDRVDLHVEARKGLAHALRIVRDCLVLPPGGAATDLAPALAHAGRSLRRHAVLFLVSDFLSDGWQRPLARCARRHDVVAVRLLPPELTPPSRGLHSVRDPESGAERVVDWSSPRVRRAYLARVADWKQRTEDDLEKAGVDRMDVAVPRTPSRDAIAGPIHRFFRMREQRGLKR